jgi:hypothetical protein
MIDRKTALICASLVALMFAAAFWRITSPEEWPAQMAWARTLPPSVVLFIFPACSALLTGTLYRKSFRVSADDPRFEPWQRWGKRFAISICAGLPLAQGVFIAQSLGVHVPPAIERTLGVLIMIVALLGINQIPKLPWFERRFILGSELGPVYGPRFMRIMSKTVFVYMIAMFAAAFTFQFVAPVTLAQRWGVPTILGATALFLMLFLLWSIVWRIRLGRRWRHEQAAHG